MFFRKKSCLILCFLFHVCFSAQSTATPGRAKLVVQAGFTPRKPACITAPQEVVAGSRALLAARVIYPDNAYQHFNPVEEHFWAYVTVEAGHLSDSVFVPDPVLLDSLRFTKWITWLDRYADSVRSATGDSLSLEQGGPSFNFCFTAPLTYAGQRIHFRVTYDSPEFGRLQNDISPDTSILGESVVVIVPALNDKCRQAAEGTYIWEANRLGDHERALQIADSLIALGCRDLAGLQSAAQSAALLDRPADQLRYMDLNFEANARVTGFPPNPDERELRDEARRYQETRQHLLQKIQQQQQQQQH